MTIRELRDFIATIPEDGLDAPVWFWPDAEEPYWQTPTTVHIGHEGELELTTL